MKLNCVLLMINVFLFAVVGCPVPSLAQSLPSNSRANRDAKEAEHVRKAIRHLQVAGLDEDARRLEQHMSLEQHTERDTNAVIEVNVQLVELLTTKMRELGIDWSFKNRSDASEIDFAHLISKLRQQKLAKILVAPTIKTVTGETASLSIDSQGTVPETHMQVASTMLEDGRVSLDIVLKLGKSYEAEATVRGKFGETQIAAFSTTPKGTELYLLVTPELDDKVATIPRKAAK